MKHQNWFFWISTIFQNYPYHVVQRCFITQKFDELFAKMDDWLEVDEYRNNPHLLRYAHRPGVNFVNVLQAAFKSADPKIANNTQVVCLFLCFWDLSAKKLLVEHWWNLHLIFCHILTQSIQSSNYTSSPTIFIDESGFAIRTEPVIVKFCLCFSHIKLMTICCIISWICCPI